MIAMLETSEERIQLLKAGYDIKKIEQLYVEDHNFTIIVDPILFKIIEFDL